MPQRILLTQLRRIGDVLMTTSAVAAVRQAYPDAHITYLTERPSLPVFKYSPDVNEVLVYPAGLLARAKLMWKLRARRFDLVVDFFGNPRSALMTWATGAPRRIGFSFPGRRHYYTDAMTLPEGVHYAGAHKAALLAPLGLRVDRPLPRLHLSAAERAFASRLLEELGVRPGELLVALSPVSRQKFRVWPLEHYARLADVLIERYSARILPLWGPGEAHFVDALRLHMRHHALPDYPIPELLNMAGLLERSHLLIGNDNGPRHMAMALGVPTVGVIGQSHPESWTPPGEAMHRAVSRDPGCKHSCTYPRCGLECILQVPYEAVEAETETLLEEILKDGHIR